MFARHAKPKTDTPAKHESVAKTPDRVQTAESSAQPVWAQRSRPRLVMQASPLTIQSAGLEVNQPGDAYEVEADRISDQVMRAPAEVMGNGSGRRVQRCACGGAAGADGECAECRAERLGLQRAAGHAPAPHEAPPIVHETLRSSGQTLDRQTRGFMESRFGQDFGHVRVHTDSLAAESAQSVSARAYTVGSQIVFGAGQYQPASDAGRRLLAHELVHTIQQSAGPLRRLSRQELDGGGENFAEITDAEDGGPVGGPLPDPAPVYGDDGMLLPNAATTPDGVDLGPTNAAHRVCHSRFSVTTGVNQNNATGASGRQDITFRTASTGNRDGADCDCGCAVYRQFVQGWWRIGGGPVRHDVGSCGHPLNISSEAEEHTSCIGDNDADACRFAYADAPGLSGLTEGTNAQLHYVFRYQIWDRCRNRSIAQARRTLNISGTNAPRAIVWSR